MYISDALSNDVTTRQTYGCNEHFKEKSAIVMHHCTVQLIRA